MDSFLLIVPSPFRTPARRSSPFKPWGLPILAIFIALVGMSVSAKAEPSLLEKASAADQQTFAGIKTAILAEAAQPPLVLAENEESYFWVMSQRIVPLIRAYHYSHDPAFLDAFVPLMQNVLSQRYIHPTKPEWDGWFAYKPGSSTQSGMAELDHETIIYYQPALLFVQEVRKDPALKEKYGKLADDWLADVQRSIKAWDLRGCWHDFTDTTGWYTFPTQTPDLKTGDLITFSGTELIAGTVFPYNKVHSLDDAMTLAYQITGDDWYRQRMQKCANVFKSHWRTDDKHVEWNYRDHMFAADYKSGVLGQGEPKTGAFVHPHPSYYILDSHDIVQLYNEGIVFTKDDINKLIQTNLEFMFMGDEKDPKFKMINGSYTAAGKYGKGTLWPDLAQFSDKVRQLWKTELDNKHGWTSSSALDYLLETSQPVSFDPRLSAKPNPS